MKKIGHRAPGENVKVEDLIVGRERADEIEDLPCRSFLKAAILKGKSRTFRRQSPRITQNQLIQ